MPTFFSYKTITLKLFLEIAESSDVSRLAISGNTTIDACQSQWEKIIEQYNYASGNLQYQNFKIHLSQYKLLMQKYNTIRSSLLSLLLVIDDPTLEYLASEGYKIVTTSQEAYDESLKNAIIKSGNLNSKLKQKFNQLQMFNQAVINRRNEFNQTAGSFEEMIATVSMHLGFALADDITLCKYNEYVKQINKKPYATGTEGHHHR